MRPISRAYEGTSWCPASSFSGGSVVSGVSELGVVSSVSSRSGVLFQGFLMLELYLVSAVVMGCRIECVSL